MDGKGAWRDNVFVERLWWSIKYEKAYLNTYKSMSEARAGISHTISDAHTDRLTGKHRIRLTLTQGCQSRQQHNQGGNPLSKTPETVQTNRASSLSTVANSKSDKTWGRGHRICKGPPDEYFDGRDSPDSVTL
jgi:hypothetical protein